MMTTLYCARWVVPVAASPIENGAVAVEGSLIASVGARDDLAAQYREAQVRDFGEAAIVPGFVNTHSHLELTAMRGYLEREEGDFFAWLKKVTIARLERMTPDDLYISAAWGAVEAARAGVTCVGDASDAASSSMRALKDVGLRGIVYQEAFGPDPADARENFEKLREKVARLKDFETELVRIGVSPHARIAHCPKSNAKFGHDRAPFARFIEKGIKVGFGSDSVASNNTCDILEEARFAILTARATTGANISVQTLDASQALQTATLGGAHALGLESQTGALIEGLQADMTVVALNGVHQTPVYDPQAALVFASSGRDVLMTM